MRFRYYFENHPIRCAVVAAAFTSLAFLGMSRFVSEYDLDPDVLKSSTVPLVRLPAVQDPILLTPGQLKSDERVGAFKAKLDWICDRLRETCREQNLEYTGPESFSPDKGYLQRNEVIQLYSHGFYYCCEPQGNSGRLEDWNNSVYQPPGPGKVDLGKAYVPIWSQERALQVAESFLHSFDFLAGLKLEEPQIEGIDSQGKWHVKWRRRDSQGHPYHNNWVLMEIQDGGCLLEMRSYVTLFEPSKTAQVIDEETAKRLASKAASKSGRGNFTLSKGSLEIVDGLAGPCLAWVFSIRYPENHGWTPPTIFIDAQTGQEVGGEIWA